MIFIRMLPLLFLFHFAQAAEDIGSITEKMSPVLKNMSVQVGPSPVPECHDEKSKDIFSDAQVIEGYKVSGFAIDGATEHIIIVEEKTGFKTEFKDSDGPPGPNKWFGDYKFVFYDEVRGYALFSAKDSDGKTIFYKIPYGELKNSKEDIKARQWAVVHTEYDAKIDNQFQQFGDGKMRFQDLSDGRIWQGDDKFTFLNESGDVMATVDRKNISNQVTETEESKLSEIYKLRNPNGDPFNSEDDFIKKFRYKILPNNQGFLIKHRNPNWGEDLELIRSSGKWYQLTDRSMEATGQMYLNERNNDVGRPKAPLMKIKFFN